MKHGNPPHIHEYENRHGVTVYYLRKPGCPKIRLRLPPGALPWSPAFMTAYEAALGEVPEPPSIGERRTVAGTVSAALVSYYDSNAFLSLAKSTRAMRRAILERFRAEHGDKRIALMHSTALQAILGSKGAIVQRNWRKALRGFIDHCLTLNLVKVDPLIGVKLTKLKTSTGFHTWTEEEIETFRRRHERGTKARLALELLLQTGHARSDVIRMGPQHVKNGKLTMSRQKTGVVFSIPLLPELVAELQMHAADHLAFLVTEQGKPHTAAGFGNWFSDRCVEAGVPGRAHGLRKASAVRHALNGATASELMAWHGWKTIAEAQRYVEQADKIRLAESAGAKMRTGIGPPCDLVSQNGKKQQ